MEENLGSHQLLMTTTENYQKFKNLQKNPENLKNLKKNQNFQKLKKKKFSENLKKVKFALRLSLRNGKRESEIEVKHKIENLYNCTTSLLFAKNLNL